MNAKIRAWGVNLLLLLVTGSLVLAGFEVALRLFLPQKLYRFPRHLFQEDAELVFRLRPGFQGELRNPEYHTRVRINRLGLRGPEVGPPSPSTHRVLMMGDSFVAGLNVDEEETFSAVLGRWLNSSLPGRRFDVINGGAPNYGTWHEVRLLRRLFPEVRPDVVVLCVFPFNDVENNQAPRKATVRDGLLVERAGVRLILPEFLQEWLQRNSMAYVYLWSAWNQVRTLVGGAKVDPLAGFNALISGNTGPGVEEGYRLSGDLLREFSGFLKERGVPGLVVIIPAEIQVYPERFARWLNIEPGSSPVEATGRPNDRWMRLAGEAGLPALDLLPLFRARADGPHLYMSLDSHFTREGNRLVGEAIGEAVRRVLPGGPGGPP